MSKEVQVKRMINSEANFPRLTRALSDVLISSYLMLITSAFGRLSFTETIALNFDDYYSALYSYVGVTRQGSLLHWRFVGENQRETPEVNFFQRLYDTLEC